MSHGLMLIVNYRGHDLTKWTKKELALVGLHVVTSSREKFATTREVDDFLTNFEQLFSGYTMPSNYFYVFREKGLADSEPVTDKRVRGNKNKWQLTKKGSDLAKTHPSLASMTELYETYLRDQPDQQ